MFAQSRLAKCARERDPTVSVMRSLRSTLRSLAWSACFLAACSGPPRESTPPARPAREGFHHRFTNAKEWSKTFDDPARDAWQKPEDVIGWLNLRADSRVADLGAGTGYFAVRIAKRVPTGRVFGADIEPDMVRFLADRATSEGLPNLRSVQTTEDDARLPEPVDAILVVDTYHHISGRQAYFRKLLASLRPDGEVMIVDFTHEATMGPPVEHRVSPDRVRAEMSEAGYVFVASHALPNQFVLTFRAAPRTTP